MASGVPPRQRPQWPLPQEDWGHLFFGFSVQGEDRRAGRGPGTLCNFRSVFGSEVHPTSWVHLTFLGEVCVWVGEMKMGVGNFSGMEVLCHKEKATPR